MKDKDLHLDVLMDLSDDAFRRYEQDEREGIRADDSRCAECGGSVAVAAAGIDCKTCGKKAW